MKPNKTAINRRQSPRFRVDRSMNIPIHIFPVLPFLGEAVEAQLLNISATGMAMIANFSHAKGKIAKGTTIKIHFRLPGHPLCECKASVVRNDKVDEHENFIGLRFVKIPKFLPAAIEKCWGNQSKNGFEIALQHLD